MQGILTMADLLSCSARNLVWTSALLLTVSCQWVLGRYDLEDSPVFEPSAGGIAGAPPDEPGGAVASGGEAPSAAGTDTASLSSGGASDIAAVSAAGRGVSGTAEAAGNGGSPNGGSGPTAGLSSEGGADSPGGTSPTGGSGPTGGAPTGGSSPTGGAPTGGDTSSGGMAGTGGSEEPGCSGELYSGICWYLGALGDSCTDTCADHGGTAAEAATYVGTSGQGGSLAECEAILDLLGVANANRTEQATSDYGVGCVLFFGTVSTGQPYWITNTPFDPDDSLASGQGRMACGCNE